MSDQPLVSCIIIFLNEERFLAEAIESVLSQDYPHKELLLIDDGSTDASREIAMRYVGIGNGSVRYLQHEGGANRGMSASRNLGIRHANGTYLAFLDGDDVWCPGKLSSQVELFLQHPTVDMVCGATLYWYNWENGQKADDFVAYVGEVRRLDHYSQELEQDRIYSAGTLVHRLYPLARGATPSASGYMVTRDLAERVGGFEEEFRGIFEDQVFRAKVFLSAETFVSSMCFDRYRQHAQSSVHVSRKTGAIDEARRHFFRWYASYAAIEHSDDKNLINAIRLARPRRRTLREALRRAWENLWA